MANAIRPMEFYKSCFGRLEISASDWLPPDRTPIRGKTVCLYLSGGTFEELKTLFERLSEGAEVSDSLKDFGTYRALNDKFGVRWMFQTDRSLSRSVLRRTKRHRSDGYEIHSADVRHEGGG